MYILEHETQAMWRTFPTFCRVGERNIWSPRASVSDPSGKRSRRPLLLPLEQRNCEAEKKNQILIQES